MNIATAIRERLLEMAPLASIVSDRVYVDVLPQKPVLPAVKVFKVTELETLHLRGRVGVLTGRVQVDCIARTKAQADSIAMAVKGDGNGNSATGLLGWFGTIGGSPAEVEVIKVSAGVTVDDVERIDEHYEFKVSREFDVMWREAA